MAPAFRSAALTLAACAAFFTSASALAIEPFGDLLRTPGSAGLGTVVRAGKSPYLGGGTRYDLLPLYLYEGERLFLHGGRMGIKLLKQDDDRLDLFVEQRFEGFSADKIGPALAGMAPRTTGLDLGLSWSSKRDWGTVQAELLRDVSHASRGTEARVAYGYPLRSGRLALQPNITLSARDAKLNDYYFGVLPGEATATRPAYAPGSGISATIGLYGSYDISERWRLLGGVSRTRFDSGIRNSPIVRDGSQTSVYLGAAYDFGAYKNAWAGDRTPTYVKVLHGNASSDACILVKIVTLRCTSTKDVGGTSITGIQIGKPFIEKLNGWPLDFVGHLALSRHNEKGFQPNGYQVDAFMKAYYTGLPWNSRVQTRLGLGLGVSLAQRAPYDEVASQAARGRPTSRLLNYMDPTIDFSLGDVIGSAALHDTFLGVGVSHRSGIFGSSQLLGSVNGGSNFIYTYLETKL
jgi:outer membrane protein